MRFIATFFKRLFIGIVLTIIYLFIGMVIEDQCPPFTPLILWGIGLLFMLKYTPMKYVLIFTIFFGITTDAFSDIAKDISSEVSGDLTADLASSGFEGGIAESGGAHFVDPHWVEGYYRGDGTFVDGYWRDGDGNPDTLLTTEEGGGYSRPNPR